MGKYRTSRRPRVIVLPPKKQNIIEKIGGTFVFPISSAKRRYKIVRGNTTYAVVGSPKELDYKMNQLYGRKNTLKDKIHFELLSGAFANRNEKRRKK